LVVAISTEFAVIKVSWCLDNRVCFSSYSFAQLQAKIISNIVMHSSGSKCNA